MSAAYGSIACGGGDTAQPLALAKRLSFIERHLVPGRTRFLDCGCGAGQYVFALADRLSLDAWGVEYEPAKAADGRQHPGHGHRIALGDVQALESESDSWDYAMLNEVLEHVPDDTAAVREVHRVLKPGGRLFVFSPNRWYPFETHGVYLKGSDRFLSPWVPFVPYVPLTLGNRVFRYWARNYWHSQLRRLLVAAGFSIVDRTFIWQTFEGISGHQPAMVFPLRPLLRGMANLAERLPLANRFGVSQVLCCAKT
jgi:ubiquinone/menaquinone biosynthesis C-methylase UbiE